ncbi:sensor histidine kinase [Lapidilactobacillus mulanensis]|uniref:histidine kinase n=1 Tax=Lapidilactobacillus mulanensis TaxID=2485999 RepID=A0ABW4DJL5_9LACO|nr:ATP-binding protein [Lapidilactobacillus mulanensis]
MKSKLRLRRFWIGFLAVCFYLLMFFLVNQFLATSQREQLQHFGNEYQQEVDTADHSQTFARWRKNFQIHSIDLPVEGSTELARVAKNVVNHNLINSNDPFTRVQYQGRSNWLYLVTDANNNRQAILVQPVSTIQHDYLRTWMVFTIIYLLIVSLLSLLLFRSSQKRQQKIKQLTANLKTIEENQEQEPVILTPDDPLFDLASQVNRLGQSMSDQFADAKLQKQSLRSLIENLPLGVMLLDESGQVEMANHALGEILDTHVWPDHLANYMDYVKTYALSRMIEHALRNPTKHTHRRRDIQLVGDEGRFVAADVISLVSQVGTEQKQKVLVMLYDLTEIKQNERMQLDFVTNASHELRTPVTSIAGFAETLLDGAKDDPEKSTEFLKIIRDQAQHLEALIHDILLLSKADQDRPLKWEPVDVGQVVNEEVQVLHQPIKDHQLHVSVVTDQYQQPTLTDQVKIRQIIRNLLTNAVSYNHPDGKIIVQLQTTADSLVMNVQDTGDGLTTEDQARVFERFYRTDHSHQHDQGGTGLGLAIVANLVDQLGGKVSVKSQLGVGSIFTVELPLNVEK